VDAVVVEVAADALVFAWRQSRIVAVSQGSLEEHGEREVQELT